VRLSERETAAYCIVSGIDYLVDECPMAAGNRHLGYKDALNSIELQSPGTKSDFYSGFLRKAAELFRGAVDHGEDDLPDLTHCERCGAPSTAELCAFCRLVDKATGVQGSASAGRASDGPVAAQPVTLTTRPRPTPSADGAGTVPTRTNTEAEARS
jgi:uncharacterized protein (TIGR00269 family)